MDRRTFLGASSAPLLAGCSELSGEEAQENTTDGIEERPQVDGNADIQITDEQWVEEGSLVEFFVGNDGTTPSGAVSAAVRWYDGSNNYLGSDSVSIHSLLDGSSWHVAVESTAPFEAESFDVVANYNPGRATGREDLALLEYELLSEEAAIVGRVENTKDEPARADVLAAAYDGGWLSHTGTVGESSIPPKETWRFRLPLGGVDWQDPRVGDKIDIYLES